MAKKRSEEDLIDEIAKSRGVDRDEAFKILRKLSSSAAYKKSDGSYVTRKGVVKKRIAVVLTVDQIHNLKVKAAGHRNISTFLIEALDLDSEPKKG